MWRWSHRDKKRVWDYIRIVNHSRDIPCFSKQCRSIDRIVSHACGLCSRCRLRSCESYIRGLLRYHKNCQDCDIQSSIANQMREERLKNKNDHYCRHESIPSTPLSTDSTSPLSPTSAYFTTSEGKARFLTRYSRDMIVEGSTRQEDVPPIIPTNSLDLRQKKVYWIKSL